MKLSFRSYQNTMEMPELSKGEERRVTVAMGYCGKYKVAGAMEYCKDTVWENDGIEL